MAHVVYATLTWHGVHGSKSNEANTTCAARCGLSILEVPTHLDFDYRLWAARHKTHVLHDPRAGVLRQLLRNHSFCAVPPFKSEGKDLGAHSPDAVLSNLALDVRQRQR